MLTVPLFCTFQLSSCPNYIFFYFRNQSYRFVYWIKTTENLIHMECTYLSSRYSRQSQWTEGIQLTAQQVEVKSSDKSRYKLTYSFMQLIGHNVTITYTMLQTHVITNNLTSRWKVHLQYIIVNFIIKLFQETMRLIYQNQKTYRIEENSQWWNHSFFWTGPRLFSNTTNDLSWAFQTCTARRQPSS